MDIKEVFAQRLIQLREDNNITQQTLADDLGITRQSLSLYENADRTINIDLLYKIAKYFKVSSDYLLGLTENTTTDTDLQSVCEYTGLSENAIENIKKINYSDCLYCIPQCEQTETPLPVDIEELDLLDDVTCKYKKAFLNYLFEYNAVAPMLSQALRHAIIKKRTIEFHGNNRASKHNNDYEDYCFMNIVKNFLSHYAVAFSNETDIYFQYICAENKERPTIFLEEFKNL